MSGSHGGGRRPRIKGRPTKDAAAHARRKPGQRHRAERVRVGKGHVGPDVEGLRVGAQQRGGPSERPGDSGPQRGLEHRQRLVPNPAPSVFRVSVVRVVPHRKAFGGAGGSHSGPGEVEQRPSVMPADRCHPSEGSGARTAREAEQHRLRLVIPGVPQQDDGRAEPLRDRIEDGVASVPSSGLRSGASLHDVDPRGLDRRQTDPGRP